MCDLREIDLNVRDSNGTPIDIYELDYSFASLRIDEYILGGLSDPIILKIPPGIAHGCKVLQGPAKLQYITSKVYDPNDEERILYDALGYDWLKEDIR